MHVLDGPGAVDHPTARARVTWDYRKYVVSRYVDQCDDAVTRTAYGPYVQPAAMSTGRMLLCYVFAT